MTTNIKPLNLVLDLDSTLIYCLLPSHPQLTDDYKDIFRSDKNYIGTLQSPFGFMFYRPNLQDFFDKVKECFNIYIVSFASEGYVNIMKNQLEKKFNIKILGTHSDQNKDRHGRKTIGLLDPNYTYIIDDSPEVWSNFCIPIKKFVPYLEILHKMPNNRNELEIKKNYNDNDKELFKALEFIMDIAIKREKLLDS